MSRNPLSKYDHSDFEGIPVLTESKAGPVDEKMSLLAQDYIANLDKKLLSGKKPNIIQQSAAHRFAELLKTRKQNEPLRVHYIAPTGTGKTLTAAMLGEMSGRPLVYVAHSIPGAEQAYRELTAHFAQQNKKVALYPELTATFEPGESDVNEQPAATIILVHQLVDHYTEIDWSSVGSIFVDEADVSSLSKKRSEVIKEITEKYGVIGIGASATELQSSGKDIKDLFPEKLLRWSMPESIQECLKQGITPPMSFNDLYLEIELPVDAESVRKNQDLDSYKLRSAMKSKKWHSEILSHYQEFSAANKQNEEIDASTETKKHLPGLVIFRDNETVKDFIAESEKVGVVVLPFTSEQNQEERDAARKAIEDGTAHLLAGSKLPGRGFNLPALRVIYNSLVGFSPQEFWQAAGRVMRMEESDPDKIAHAFCVVPGKITDQETSRDLTGKLIPLTFSLFFSDEPIFVPGRESANNGDGEPRPVRSFEVKNINVVRSIQEVRNFISAELHAHGLVDYQVDSLAKIYDLLDEHHIGLRKILGLAKMPKWKLDKLIATLEAYLEPTDYKLPNGDDDEARATQNTDPQINNLKIGLRRFEMRAEKERKLLEQRFALAKSQDPTDQKRLVEIRNQICMAYMPLAISLMQHMAEKDADVSDNVQDMAIEIMDAIDKHDPSRHGRLLPLVFYAAYHKVTQDAKNAKITIDNEPDENMEGELDFNEIIETKDQIAAVLSLTDTALKPSEKNILQLKFQLKDMPEGTREDKEDQDDPTLLEIGNYWGVSRSRIGQIYDHALSKLLEAMGVENEQQIPAQNTSTEILGGRGYFRFIDNGSVPNKKKSEIAYELAQSLRKYPRPNILEFVDDTYKRARLTMGGISLVEIAKTFLKIGLITNDGYTEAMTGDNPITLIRFANTIDRFVKNNGDIEALMIEIENVDELKTGKEDPESICTEEQVNEKFKTNGALRDYIIQHLHINFEEKLFSQEIVSVGDIPLEVLIKVMIARRLWLPVKGTKGPEHFWKKAKARKQTTEDFLRDFYRFLQQGF